MFLFRDRSTNSNYDSISFHLNWLISLFRSAITFSLVENELNEEMSRSLNEEMSRSLHRDRTLNFYSGNLYEFLILIFKL